MKYISSDTNIWLDFLYIHRLELPFRLPYIYLMSNYAIEDELLSPPQLRQQLLNLGMESTALSDSELLMFNVYLDKYNKPSRYDCMALAIAKCRGITLLTGDRALRKAAVKEGVEVMGTIGLLDLLKDKNLINTQEYLYCLKTLQKENGGNVRLPGHELQIRIDKFGKDNN